MQPPLISNDGPVLSNSVTVQQAFDPFHTQISDNTFNMPTIRPPLVPNDGLACNIASNNVPASEHITPHSTTPSDGSVFVNNNFENLARCSDRWQTEITDSFNAADSELASIVLTDNPSVNDNPSVKDDPSVKDNHSVKDNAIAKKLPRLSRRPVVAKKEPSATKLDGDWLNE